MLRLISITLLVMTSTYIAAQNVSFLDNNFKNALLTHSPTIDTNGDGEIQQTEATAFTGSIEIPFKAINNLTGIQAFENIIGLNCYNNNLSTVDLSQNQKLEILNLASNNLIGNLNLIGLTALERLSVNDNMLSTLNLSSNTSLEYLSCGNNQLMLLEVNSINLRAIYCSGNNLLQLNLITCLGLRELECANNQLTSLNITFCPVLTRLVCLNNMISELDFSFNNAMLQVNCNNNQLTTLDLSPCQNLMSLACANNQLERLNIANGNNTALQTINIKTNPSLNCVQVDPTMAHNIPFPWQHDSHTSFAENCFLSTSTTFIEESIYPNPVSEILYIDNIANERLIMYNMKGQQVYQARQVSNIDMSLYPKGVYMLEIQTENGILITKQLIKE